MATLGNIIWFILCGWWNGLVYSLLGVLFCITIIGIPIGKSMFQYAKLMAFPFGKVIVKETLIKGAENVSAIRKVGGIIANIIWLPFGIVTFIANIGLMLVCFISIIFIPFGIVIAKSCKFLLWPIGAKVISKDEALAIRIGNVVQQNNNANQNVQAATSAQTVTDSYKENTTYISTPNAVVKEPNQTLENLKAGVMQALGSLKETGGKATAAVVQKSEEGMSSIKKYQEQTAKRALAQEKGYTLNALLEEIEAKLYHNKIMAWIMPMIEYITVIGSILFIVIAVISTVIHYDWFSPSFYMLHLGFYIATPFLWISALLGMIKRNHILVLAIMGVQAFDKLICLFSGNDEIVASVILLLCYVGILVLYVLTFLNKGSAPLMNAGTRTVSQPNYADESGSNAVNALQQTQNATGSKATAFCSQCGTEYNENTKFCAKCGNRLK